MVWIRRNELLGEPYAQLDDPMPQVRHLRGERRILSGEFDRDSQFILCRAQSGEGRQSRLQLGQPLADPVQLIGVPIQRLIAEPGFEQSELGEKPLRR
ncbi:hypothetical protein [Nocardia acididurans]|uniref:hypothetical protein n=1 Tax=Nocardia acididurans TaxID=2802282 RepID=UPI001E558D0D|nr:hypothetical protein [Nocardia acididurans]